MGGIRPPIVLAPNSNYVGSAALDTETERVIWWTTAGRNGGPGTFTYSCNFGEGWKASVTSDLAPHNMLGYVCADVQDDNQISLVGQTWLGGPYPEGSACAVVADVTLGQPIQTFTLGAEDSAARAGADIFTYSDSGDVYVIAESWDLRLEYFHRPANALMARSQNTGYSVSERGTWSIHPRSDKASSRNGPLKSESNCDSHN